MTTTTTTRDAGAEHEHDQARGRDADAPHEIPPKGWKDILLRVKTQLREDEVTLVAASVAFYALLALFPTLIALVTLYGLVASPADVQAQVSSMATMMPESARAILEDQMRGIVGASGGTLGLGLLISLGGALWAASGGMMALMRAVNIAYDEEETRGFFALRAQALVLTLGALLFAGLAIFAVAVLPAIFALVGLGEAAESALSIGRWPLLAVLAAVGLSVLYRYAPCRTRAKWRWVTWGGAIATLIWLGGTALFSLYVAHFGSYNETYGTLGGVVVLLLWLYVSAFAILLGAEIDSELEHQTAEDSTVGEPAPMGERGAEMADTLGRSYS